MGAVVAVDPGKHRCGVAVFLDGELAFAGTTRTAATPALVASRILEAVRRAVTCPREAIWVVERPVRYARQRESHVNLDALDASIHALRLKVPEAKWVELHPSEWKGQLPKRVSRDRTRAKLAWGERSAVDPRANHDAWDAISIGLFHLGR